MVPPLVAMFCNNPTPYNECADGTELREESMNPITPNTLQTHITTLVDHLAAGEQVPNGTPIALVFIAAALQFFPTILGGSGVGGNLGDSTIEHDIQNIMLDVVGILQHPQTVEQL